MAWFRFHNKAEGRKWAGLQGKPRAVWQGADPDLPQPAAAAGGAGHACSGAAPAGEEAARVHASTLRSLPVACVLGNTTAVLSCHQHVPCCSSRSNKMLTHVGVSAAVVQADPLQRRL